MRNGYYLTVFVTGREYKRHYLRIHWRHVLSLLAYAENLGIGQQTEAQKFVNGRLVAIYHRDTSGKLDKLRIY